nr:hypothetical protein [Flammeovirgaceae bacterium]
FFIQNSQVPSLLFFRDFMEYHSNRFQDFSLMIFEDESLFGVLPANIHENTLYSHQGLTYGGLVFNKKMNLEKAMACFHSLFDYLNQQKIDQLIYKTCPDFAKPEQISFEDFPFQKVHAQLINQEISFAINLNEPIQIQQRRKRAINKASKLNLEIKKDENWKGFWENLENNLNSKFQAQPTHSLQEILYLKEQFPNHIHLFTCNQNTELLSGMVIFSNSNFIHAQYISSSEKGRAIGAVDFLMNHLLNYFSNFNYFSLGVCTNKENNTINKGLMKWKEGFDAKPFTQNTYSIDTKNFHLLEKIFI